MTARYSLGQLLRKSLMLTSLLVISFSNITFAITSGDVCSEEMLRAAKITMVNCSGESDCAPVARTAFSDRNSGFIGKSIYMLGDSITAGAEDQIEALLTQSGISITKINASPSRHISSPGDDGYSGIQALNNDSKFIESSEGVIISLGTNPNGANEKGVSDIVSTVRSHNPSAPIYWVSIFSPGASNKDEFNDVLRQLSTNGILNVLDITSANIEISSDRIHPTTGTGSNTYASAVVSSLLGNKPSTTTASGCTCSAVGNGNREENEKNIWGYLTTTRNLSAEAAAGIMGSIHDESGFDPHNTQDTAPVPDGPEIPIESIRGKWGYGIIQWTFPSRQDGLVAFAREQGKSTGDLGLQLDYLWKELTENYEGSYAALSTPGISLREASDEVTLRFVVPGAVTKDHGTAETRARKLQERFEFSQIYYNKFSGQTIGFSGGASCNTSGVNIDLESQDTTHIMCGGNTVDAGVAKGYRQGKEYDIRLCTVGGTQANSQIAASLEKLLADSQANGVNISFGSFRTMDRQIEMYTSRCLNQGLTPTPAPHPRASYRDYQRCDSIAPPGYSNHQMGLAIDVSCDGVLVPRYHPAASSNKCYQWLVANSVKYGLYEFGKGQGNKTSGGYEAWHWSVDGD